ncbi:hypothetical protein F2Q70_00031724 [Brassica cretica]|uniref:UBC core domain-containing protein n=1 Tax=Brassica cretica TaxID=69181 RepID=A0A8S9FIS6_BRACR|nr:hypothetical protein F2Q70_00031724 [Brassica cretica]
MTVRFNGLIPVKLLLLASSEQISRRQTTACVLYEGCPLHHFSIATSLLCDPNPNSPANSEAARMFSENKREYNRRVREVVEQSWTAD